MKQTITQYLMIIMMVVGAYLIGVYKTKSDMLEKGIGTNTNTQQQAQAQAEAAPTKATDEQIKTLFEGKGNIVLGKKDAKLTVVEFSDPSCPYCHIAGGLNPELNNQVGSQFKMIKDGGSYAPVVPEVKKLVEEGKAKLVWLYTPGHGNGELATKALYCANEKGKFWEVHDKLFTSEAYDLINNTIKNDIKNSAALASFLAPVFPTSEMQKCLESDKYNARIVDDPKTVASIGRFGTPTFIFDTSIFEGAQSYEGEIKTLVEKVLK